MEPRKYNTLVNITRKQQTQRYRELVVTNGKGDNVGGEK